jgi:glutaredoxin
VEPATAAPETAAPETAAPTKIAKVTKVRRAPVIVYQASWCGPCHQLSAHLTRRGVRHVDKDIDSTPGALDEMNAKTARAGHAGAQLPVMDFRGRIVIGYDPAAVDRLCDEDAAASAGG